MNLPPHKARRPTLLIVGCGDIGQRVLRLLHPRWRLLALSSSPAKAPVLRAAGATVLSGDLDRPDTLGRLGALADMVLHLAPPPAHGDTDTRTRALLRALARGGRVRRLVYASTSGVYGDAGGALFDETRALKPGSDRARRRADAEARVRWFGRSSGVTVTVLRIPGIYAAGRPGGDPRQRPDGLHVGLPDRRVLAQRELDEDERQQEERQRHDAQRSFGEGDENPGGVERQGQTGAGA